MIWVEKKTEGEKEGEGKEKEVEETQLIWETGSQVCSMLLYGISHNTEWKLMT